MKKILVVCDLETNGFKATDSVLSICMIKLEVDTEDFTMRRIEYYDKYYHLKDGEAPNAGAIGVNGLTRKVIEEMRLKSKEDFGNYPEHFHEDTKSMYAFLEDCDLFVTHNTGFDTKFFNRKPKNIWCSMKNAPIEAKEYSGRLAGKNSKDPKLMELAAFLNIKLEVDNLHGSKYDTMVLEKCLCRLLKRKDEGFLGALSETKGRGIEC